MNFSELFGNAQWVTCDSGCTSPVIKGGFFIEEPKEAEITICGLGFFRLWINGREVSEDKFVPVNSQYCKRDLTAFEYPILDELSYRTYAVRYDISKFVIDGKMISASFSAAAGSPSRSAAPRGSQNTAT